MSVFTTRPATRWLVPAAAALVVLGGGVVLRTAAAAADPTLPSRTAAQLLVDLQTTKLDAMSGTVVEHADLGVPSIPGAGGQGSSDLSSMITGDHTLRVWYSGPQNARVALLGTLGESDVIRAGTDVWTWDSRGNTATHRTLAAGASGADAKRPGLPTNLPRTPQEAADQALRAIDPSTVVSTAGSAQVAGRAAYELIIAPRDRASLVSQVRLAIDAQHHVPLRVQVYARNVGKAAVDVSFTQVSFARPDASEFRFAPPRGVKVTEDSTTSAPDAKQQPDATKPSGDQPVVIGAGWTAVVAARMPDVTSGIDARSADSAAPSGEEGQSRQLGQLAALLGKLPRKSGSWGSGRVLAGKLFSVLITDDGRVLAGAVAPERLYQAAADPKAVALKATK